MSRTRSLHVALFLSLAVAGCSHSADPVRPTHATSSGGITTAIQVASSTVAPGGVIDLALSVTNHESSVVTLRFRSTCQLLYVVYDQSGTVVSGSVACGMALTELTLKGGETKQQPSRWGAARWDPVQGVSVPLPAGEYRIQAYLAGYGYDSEPVTVRVE